MKYRSSRVTPKKGRRVTTSGGRAQVLVHYADGDWESMCVACRAAFDAAAEAGDEESSARTARELTRRRSRSASGRSGGEAVGMFEWHT